MPKKQTLLFILLLTIFTMAFSGCTEQPENNQVNNDNQQQEEQQEEQDQNKEGQKDNNKEEVSTEIKYLDNGEIDTSDWKTYRNKVYGLEMKYPPFLEASKKDNDRFSFNLENDWSHYYYFNKAGIFYYNDKKSFEERKEHCIEDYSDNPGYKKIKVKNGCVFFYYELTKGGYNPTATILSEKDSLFAHKEIYSQTPNFDKEDQKYIDIFKASIETIKFEN